MVATLSTQLADFAAGSTYDATPARVIDKAKACVLQNITAGLLSTRSTEVARITALIRREEPRSDGATILGGERSKVSRCGAAFANSSLMYATKQVDSYLMLTHPGPVIIPATLATCEIEERTGREFLTALVVGYEVQCRIAKDFIPATQSRGFRASPVYGVFGAAIATAKLLRFGADKMACTISLAAAAASGNIESAKKGAPYMHEPNASRTGALAAMLASKTDQYAETVLEGKAGFYHAFTGNNEGRLSYAYSNVDHADLNAVVSSLGRRYEMLNVLMKPYATSGYNIPVIDLVADLKRKHNIEPGQVKNILIEVNWLEISYPSPAFPKKELQEPNPGSMYYFAAYALVNGGYPAYVGLDKAKSVDESPELKRLMSKVRIVGSKERNISSPKILITMMSGAVYSGEYTGKEYDWTFEETARRIISSDPDLGMPKTQLKSLIDCIQNLEEVPIKDMLALCRPKK